MYIYIYISFLLYFCYIFAIFSLFCICHGPRLMGMESWPAADEAKRGLAAEEPSGDAGASQGQENHVFY